MGWTLFGSAADKSQKTETTNLTYDYTKSDSENVEGSFNTEDSRVWNTTNVRNQSAINNDTKIANTALQLTDSFNRFSTNNLANVGNTNIGASGTNADDTAKLLLAFKGLQPPRGLNDAVPDLNKPLLDFTALSRIATDNITASGGVAEKVFGRFAKNVTAAGQATAASASASGDPTAGIVRIVIIGALVLAGIWLIFKKGK